MKLHTLKFSAIASAALLAACGGGGSGDPAVPEAGAPPVVVVTNFTPVPRENYVLPLPSAGRWREILNTDAGTYGGSGQGNMGGVTALAEPSHGKPASARVMLPPLATLYFAFAPQKKS